MEQGSKPEIPNKGGKSKKRGQWVNSPRSDPEYKRQILNPNENKDKYIRKATAREEKQQLDREMKKGYVQWW